MNTSLIVTGWCDQSGELIEVAMGLVSFPDGERTEASNILRCYSYRVECGDSGVYHTNDIIVIEANF